MISALRSSRRSAGMAGRTMSLAASAIIQRGSSHSGRSSLYIGSVLVFPEPTIAAFSFAMAPVLPWVGMGSTRHQPSGRARRRCLGDTSTARVQRFGPRPYGPGGVSGVTVPADRKPLRLPVGLTRQEGEDGVFEGLLLLDHRPVPAVGKHV